MEEVEGKGVDCGDSGSSRLLTRWRTGLFLLSFCAFLLSFKFKKKKHFLEDAGRECR